MKTDHLQEPRHTPRLSVIVPVYNTEKFLRPCLDSLRQQSLTDMEIILVNDCSTDSSAQICDEYAALDSRIKVIHMPENRGPGIARNVGLDYADGDYCTFFDSDDKMHPDAYQIMYDFAVKNKLDIVRCETAIFSEENPKPKRAFRQFGQEQIYTKPEDLREMAVNIFSSPISAKFRDLNFGGSVAAALHHRNLFENGGIRFPRTPHMISEDFIFDYECLRKARRVGLLPLPLYYYRINLESRCNVPRADILERAMSTAEVIEQTIIRDGYPEEYLEFAYMYVISTTRAFIKNWFLSSIPVVQIKQWFDAQHDYPVLERAYRFGIHKQLPLRHRINFLAFYKKRFYTLLAMVRGRELLR